MELPKNFWRKNLLTIKPEVKNIFYKGNIDLLTDSGPKLAIVGSRRITDYGVRVIEKWMPEIVSAGITVVSGFMYGVDMVAHKACLESGGNTIAVLGWGIDRKPSSFDEKMYDKVIEVGSLIVSEYGGEMGAEKWTFPARNRIVAGVSDAVLVVEAAPKSGSLITARLARKFGKSLLAVPGMVTSKVAEGTNDLLKKGEAEMVTSASDLISAMGLICGQMKLEMREESDPLLTALELGERSVDELARVLRKSVPEVLGKLTELSLKGVLMEKNGKVGLK